MLKASQRGFNDILRNLDHFFSGYSKGCLLVVWLLLIAGCGSSDSDDSDENCGTFGLIPICFVEAEPDSPSPEPTASWHNVYNDIDPEPNDPIDNSINWPDEMVMSRTVSLIANGTVNDSDDPADYHRFKAWEDIPLLFYLCDQADNCEFPTNGGHEYFRGDEIYLELYDGDGNLLESTFQNQTANGHEINFSGVAEQFYTVAVKAASTTGADFSYRFVLSDSDFP